MLHKCIVTKAYLSISALTIKNVSVTAALILFARVSCNQNNKSKPLSDSGCGYLDIPLPRVTSVLLEVQATVVQERRGHGKPM